jgi:hypothetical protein
MQSDLSTFLRLFFRRNFIASMWLPADLAGRVRIAQEPLPLLADPRGSRRTSAARGTGWLWCSVGGGGSGWRDLCCLRDGTNVAREGERSDEAMDFSWQWSPALSPWEPDAGWLTLAAEPTKWMATI